MGDLVYDSGAWKDYDPKFFEPYAPILPHTTFWRTLGNHDTSTENGAFYFDAFNLPTDTCAPGLPSNTEHYDSFDHGRRLPGRVAAADEPRAPHEGTRGGRGRADARSGGRPLLRRAL